MPADLSPAGPGQPPRGAHAELDHLVRLRHAARDLDLGRQRRAFSPLVGPHPSRFRGRGLEFEEVRAYQAGDDIRNIDWRVTARSGRPHTKLFREERERPVLLLVDQSRTMFFGSRNCCKSVMAAHIAALLAWAAFQHNDRVGGLIFGNDELAVVKPQRRPRAVLELLRQTHRLNGQLHRALPAPATSLALALEELRRITRPGANIFLISDFARCNGEGRKHLHHLSRHSDLTAVRVFDPLERQLPPPGRYAITDGERRATLSTDAAATRSRYRERFEERSTALRQILGPMGIPLLEISTAEAPLPYFQRLLNGR